MSVYFRVYVGPVLKCSPKGACDPYEVTGDELCPETCDDWSKLDYDILVSNKDWSTSGRPLTFDKFSKVDPITMRGGDETLELQEFWVAHEGSIKKLRKRYTEVRMEWAILPTFV